MANTEDLKLIYVLKIGVNSKGQGMYEFLFSETPYEVDYKELQWDKFPTSQYKKYTIPEDSDLTCSLCTDEFDLICLHDSDYFSYLHGYNSIIALAYEDDVDDDQITGEEEYVPFSEYNEQFEDDSDEPLLVLHYGDSLKNVIDKLYSRDIVLEYDKSEIENF